MSSDKDQALLEKLSGTFSNLPQQGVIEQEDATKWLENILKWHKPRAAWHAERLRGIGGSEMGAVVRGMLGLNETGFSTYERVAEHKLLKRLPDFETSHMRRGTALEKLAELTFSYRHKAIRDLESMRKIESGANVKGMEWLVGNPDDVVFMAGGRYLIDYKVPSVVDDSVDFDYEVQLNHYALGAEFKGVKLDGMFLAKLDLAPEIAAALVDRIDDMKIEDVHEMAQTIARVNLPGMRILPVPVPPNPTLRQQILECGSLFWNDHILAGKVPNQDKALLPVTELTTAQVAKYQIQYATAKAGITQLNKIASEAENAIAEALEGVDFEGTQFPQTITRVAKKPLNAESKKAIVDEALLRGAVEADISTAKKTYCVELLVSEIKRLGGEVDDSFLEVSHDPKKAEKFLEGKGVSIDAFKPEGVSLRVSTASADRKAMDALESFALDVMQPLLGDKGDDGFSDFDGEDDIALFESDNEFGAGGGDEAYTSSFDRGTDPETNTTQTPRFKGASMR